MILGVAGAYTGRGRRLHERGWLGLDRLLQPVLGGGTSVRRRGIAIAGDVEQHDTAARRGREGGDAASHGPGAHHADSRHAHSGLSPKGMCSSSAMDRLDGRGRVEKHDAAVMFDPSALRVEPVADLEEQGVQRTGAEEVAHVAARHEYAGILAVLGAALLPDQEHGAGRPVLPA